jgi:phage shock protein A
MAEPDNIVLEHLRAIRADLSELKQPVGNLGSKLESKAEAAQVADVDRNLTGLSHLVLSGFGSVVTSLESLDKRVARLERERV